MSWYLTCVVGRSTCGAAAGSQLFRIASYRNYFSYDCSFINIRSTNLRPSSWGIGAAPWSAAGGAVPALQDDRVRWRPAAELRINCWDTRLRGVSRASPAFDPWSQRLSEYPTRPQVRDCVMRTTVRNSHQT